MNNEDVLEVVEASPATRYPAPDSLAAVTASLFEDFGREGLRETPLHEVHRRGEILRQREAGAIGGGPECPVCGERALRLLDEFRAPGSPSRMRCGACGRGILMAVRGGTLKLTAPDVGDCDVCDLRPGWRSLLRYGLETWVCRKCDALEVAK